MRKSFLILFVMMAPGWVLAQTATTTATATATSTPVKAIPTATAIAVVVIPGAATATSTCTSTPTSTATLTATQTPTRTATLTATATATYTSTPGVFQFSVSAEPDKNGQIHFNWGSTIKSDGVIIKIYTSGFRLVRAFNFDKQEHPEYLDAGLHEVIWDGKDEQNRMMPPETYLCFINIVSGKKTYEASGRTSFP